MNDSSKQTILVVDDTKENVRLLVEMLTKKGYNVRPALDGRSALKSAFAQPPDLVLLDIKMPEIDGYEVCRQLKERESTKKIPIIFISALNEVFDKIKAFDMGAVDYIPKPFQFEEVLARVQTHLALRLLQKTLQAKNQELSETLEELKTTQAQLIESEKMAALGNLVGGVAHEINTPLGVGITVSSTLESATENLETALETGQLKKSVLLDYLSKAKRCSQMLSKNLQRAAELIDSFRQVAVDRTHFEKRRFGVKKYIEGVLLSLSPKLQESKHDIRVSGEEVLVNNYPGAFAQIVTNLTINSVTHGYPSGEGGESSFEIFNRGDRLIITYTDDGCGIPEENLSKIFEPFFTTARNRGGTGLGLHIIYNLVTQKLQGNIYCESQVDAGSKFILDLPLTIND